MECGINNFRCRKSLGLLTDNSGNSVNIEDHVSKLNSIKLNTMHQQKQILN